MHWSLSKHPAFARIPRKEVHYFLRQYGGVDRLTDYGRLMQFVNFVRHARFDADQETKLARVEGTDRDVYGSPWDAEMEQAWAEGGQSLDRFRRYLSTADWYEDYLRGPVNDDWYRGLFASVPDDKWAMDFSTTNFRVSDDGFKAMANYAEDTRVVLVLRDPIERLWSHLRFHAEVAGVKRLVDGWTMTELREFAAHHNLADSSFYADAVESLMRHFPKERRLIVNFEDIHAYPQGVYDDVLGLVGQEPSVLPLRDAEEPRINVSQQSSFPKGAFAHLAVDFEKDLRRLVDLGVDFAKPWIANAEAHQREQPQLSRVIPRGLGLRTVARKLKI